MKNLNNKQMKPNKGKKLTRTFALLLLMLFGSAGACWAEKYVFSYTNGETTNYLANVDGSIRNVTKFDPATCVWTCFNNNNETTLSSDYSYSLKNGSYYLNSANENGHQVSEDASRHANWRLDGNNHLIYYRSLNNYYLYYRGDSWRTSRSQNVNNNNAYSYNGTDYRATVCTESSLTLNVNVTEISDAFTCEEGSGPSDAQSFTVTTTLNGLPYTVTAPNNFEVCLTENGTYATSVTPAIPVESQTVYVRMKSGLSQGTYNDDVTVTPTWNASTQTRTVAVRGTVTGPNFMATPSPLAGFCYVQGYGQYQQAKSFQVTGSVLGTTPINIRVSDSYVFSATENGTYEPTLVLTPDGGNVDATVYVKLTDDLSAGTYNGTATLNWGSRALSQTVTLEGEVLDNEFTVTPDQLGGFQYAPGNGPSAAQTLTVTYLGLSGQLNVTLAAVSSTQGYEIATAENGPYSESLTLSANTVTTLYVRLKTGLDAYEYKSTMTLSNGSKSETVALQGEVMEISSGIYGDKVVLNDFEDHNWSYYQPNGGVESAYAYPDKLCSPYPRNVKISYYGNGLMYTGADGGNTTTATGVQVSRYETENTFVYYKTLERDANNRFPYELIPNPFSKRPTYGSDATTKWRGFYGWRIKSISGGAIYSATTGGTQCNVGDILTTEYQQLYFQPNDNSMTNANNATSMTVEFEAVWARAYRVATAANNTNANMSSNTLAADSYERNFVVVTSGTSSTNLSTGSKPCTVTMIEPDGSTDYRSSSVSINPQFIIAQNNWKFEWINIKNYGNNNNSSTISANGHNLVLGRGLMQSGANHTAGNGEYGTPGTNLCAAYVNGIGKNASNGSSTYATALDYILRIESGFYTEIAYVSAKKGSYGEASSTIHVKGFFGNDYDRALNKNERLISNGQTGNPAVCMGAEDGACISSSNHSNYNRETFNLNVKSGLIGSGSPEGWEPGNNGLYLGKALGSGASGARTCGNRRLLFEGGKIISISGGMDRTPNNNTAQAANNVETLIMRFKGTAEVLTSAYGGAATQPTYGHRILIYTGGFVHGWTATGCNGISRELGQNYGTGYMYVGGNTRIGDGELGNINGTGRGIVMGAGNGRSDSPTTGEMSYGSHVVIADNANIENEVYGGGNYGYTLSTAHIFITGGTVNGSVFGGSLRKQGDYSEIYMTGGLVKGISRDVDGNPFKGGIFGGSNSDGTFSGSVTMHIEGGQVGTAATP
ncbi:MAG: hypothetical protein MJZ91_11515, partial [Bacteroidales bacterium]|nr:hypothetical protein [Bacteroidales bacterium]